MIPLKRALKRDLIHGYSVASHSRCRSFTVNQAPQRSSTKFCAVFPVWSKVFKLSRNLSIIRQAKILWTVCLFYKLRKKCKIRVYFVRKFIRSKTLTHSCPEQRQTGRFKTKSSWQKVKKIDKTIWFWKSQNKIHNVLEWTRCLKISTLTDVNSKRTYDTEENTGGIVRRLKHVSWIRNSNIF